MNTNDVQLFMWKYPHGNETRTAFVMARTEKEAKSILEKEAKDYTAGGAIIQSLINKPYALREGEHMIMTTGGQLLSNKPKENRF